MNKTWSGAWEIRSFQKECCKLLAEIPTNRDLWGMLWSLATTLKCRPLGHTDHTEEIISILQKMGFQESKKSKSGHSYHAGYIVGNDAPRGGKQGKFIRVFLDLTCI